MDILDLLSKLDELSILRRRIIRSIDTSSLNLPVNATQEHVLMAISKSPEKTMTELSMQVGLEKSSLTRVIDSLINDGLVTRSYGVQDRRIINCVLTEKGENVAGQIDQIMKQHFEKILSCLTQGEKDELDQHLTRAIQLLSKNKPL
jgi:DNA-binding MarR family transcriptional regulator